MEPTRNAWVPLASWFRRKGARVVMVPSETSADLRDYYSKHTKSDRLGFQTLGPYTPCCIQKASTLDEHLGPAAHFVEPPDCARAWSSAAPRSSAASTPYLEILSPDGTGPSKADLTKEELPALLRSRLHRSPFVPSDRPGPPGSVSAPSLSRPLR